MFATLAPANAGGFTCMNVAPIAQGLLPVCLLQDPDIPGLPRVKFVFAWAHRVFDANGLAHMTLLVNRVKGEVLVNRSWCYDLWSSFVVFFQMLRAHHGGSGIRIEFRAPLSLLKEDWKDMAPILRQWLASATQSVRIGKVRFSRVLCTLYAFLRCLFVVWLVVGLSVC